MPVLSNDKLYEALLFREGMKDYHNDLPDDKKDNTIADLLADDPTLKQSAAFVSRAATLAEARDAMIQVEKAKVVFVTETGDQSDAIIGMFTNTDIAKHANM
ncbi:hypothetical protein KFU94_53405 [Chloroflexi bacterium TSY]|nr:hypothetical protein [Chloroflexi bacterium TSY]